ncbi:unnamed protein product, partial [Scytosiphon promiscuus]
RSIIKCGGQNSRRRGDNYKRRKFGGLRVSATIRMDGRRTVAQPLKYHSKSEAPFLIFAHSTWHATPAMPRFTETKTLKVKTVAKTSAGRRIEVSKVTRIAHIFEHPTTSLRQL